MKKKSNKGKIIKIIILILIVLGIGFGIYFYLKNKDNKNEQTIAVQKVSILTKGNLTNQNRFSGIVVTEKTVAVERDAEKIVKNIYVSVGDKVRKGEKLFDYDVNEIKLKIKAEKLELEKMEKNIKENEKQIKNIEDNSDEDPEEDELEIKSLKADIKEIKYNIKNKKVDIEKLQSSLSDIVVYSPVDGKIESINSNSNQNSDYDSDEEVSGFINIIKSGKYRVKGTINEQNIRSLKVNDKVILRSRIDENETWTGVVKSIDTSSKEKKNSYYDEGGDNSSSKYPFYVTLDSTKGLMVGQHLYIEKKEGNISKKGLMIDSSFIEQNEDGNNYVYLSDDKDRIKKEQVTLGEEDMELGLIEVLEGLSKEDYIAIPDEKVKVGMKVTKFENLDEFYENINNNEEEEPINEEEARG